MQHVDGNCEKNTAKLTTQTAEAMQIHNSHISHAEAADAPARCIGGKADLQLRDMA